MLKIGQTVYIRCPVYAGDKLLRHDVCSRQVVSGIGRKRVTAVQTGEHGSEKEMGTVVGSHP